MKKLIGVTVDEIREVCEAVAVDVFGEMAWKIEDIDIEVADHTFAVRDRGSNRVASFREGEINTYLYIYVKTLKGKECIKAPVVVKVDEDYFYDNVFMARDDEWSDADVLDYFIEQFWDVKMEVVEAELGTLSHTKSVMNRVSVGVTKGIA